MESDIILAKLRQFLLIIAAGVFLMTVTELIFVGHWNVLIQYLPFALCVLGLITLALAYFRPSPGILHGTRLSLIIIGVCSFIGFYEHMANNFWFWLDIQPNATPWELVVATLSGGIPILAPGILLLGAVIGLAALYKHPLLESK